MNRHFAKLVDGNIQFAPDVIMLRRTVEPEEEGGESIERLFSFQNPTAAQYREAGYLDVITNPEPEPVEGYHWVPDYTVQFDDTVGLDVICQIWEREADPDPDEQEVSAEEALDIILGGGDHDA